jgi:hypothetical protein
VILGTVGLGVCQIMVMNLQLEARSKPGPSIYVNVLQTHPDIITAAQAALHKYGAGLSSVRFICGTQDIHKVSVQC